MLTQKLQCMHEEYKYRSISDGLCACAEWEHPSYLCIYAYHARSVHFHLPISNVVHATRLLAHLSCVAFALPYALRTLPAVSADPVLHEFVHKPGLQQCYMCVTRQAVVSLHC